MARMGLWVVVGLPAILVIALAAPVSDKSMPREGKAQRDLKMLRQRAADPKADMAELWGLWQRFRQHAGTAEYVQAAEVMSRIPSPLDDMDPRHIPFDERRSGQPKELVAVLGEHRGRDCWNPVVVSPDGKLLATWDKFGVHLWDADSLRERGWLRCNTVSHTAVFDPSSTLLAIGSAQEVELWDLNFILKPDSTATLPVPSHDGLVAIESGHGNSVDSLAFAPDGKTLISSAPRWGRGRNRLPGIDVDLERAILWEVMAKKEGLRSVRTLLSDDTASDITVLAPDGSCLVEMGEKGCRLWRRGDGGFGAPVVLQDAGPPFAFTRDGKQLATGSAHWGTRVRLWDTTEEPPKMTRSWKTPLGGRTQHSTALAFSWDGSLLGAVVERELHLWPLTEKGRQALVPEGQTSRAIPLGALGDCLAFLPDGKAVAAIDFYGRLQVRELPTGRERFPTRGHRGPITAVALSPDCRTLASGGKEGDIRLWDLSGGKVREAGVLADPYLNPKELPSGRDGPPPILALDYAPDGKWLLSLKAARMEESLQVWDLRRATGKPSFQSRPESAVNEADGWFFLRVAPRGDRVLTASLQFAAGEGVPRDGKAVVQLWDWREGKMELLQEVRVDDQTLHLLGGRLSKSEFASLSPDGKLLVLSIGQAYLQLWDMVAKPPRRIPWTDEAHLARDTVSKARLFFPDGQTLLTMGQKMDLQKKRLKRVIQFWDVSGPVPKERRRIEEELNPVLRRDSQIALSPDGKLLALVYDGKLTVRKVDSWETVWSHSMEPGVVFCFAPDSRHLITGNSNGTLYVLRLLPTPSRHP
jgi:WD40 repeat protein